MATSIFDMFKGRQNATAPVTNNAAPQAPANPQGALNVQNNPAADPTKPGAVPANGQSNPTKDEPPISPLDTYSKLWDSPTTPDGKPRVDPLAQPLLSTDPQKLAEAARKMDFTSGIDPALMTKALGGDSTALAQIINASTQNAFIASATLAGNMAEGATKTNNSRLDQTLNERFKEFLVQQQKSDNPILQHKAVAPLLDLTKKQLTQQYPDKTASEIHSMAEGFVTDFAGAFTGQQQENERKKTNNAADPGDFSSW